MGFGGRLIGLAKEKTQTGQAAERLGIDTKAGQRGNTPPPPQAPAQEAPAAPTAPAAEAAPTEERTRPQNLGAPRDAALQNALGRMLSGVSTEMQTKRLQRLGKPGSQRQQFFNMFGRAPTAREIGAWNVRLELERQHGRPPTVQEVKIALRQADFIDRSPEPFA